MLPVVGTVGVTNYAPHLLQAHSCTPVHGNTDPLWALHSQCYCTLQPMHVTAHNWLLLCNVAAFASCCFAIHGCFAITGCCYTPSTAAAFTGCPRICSLLLAPVATIEWCSSAHCTRILHTTLYCSCWHTDVQLLNTTLHPAHWLVSFARSRLPATELDSRLATSLFNSAVFLLKQDTPIIYSIFIFEHATNLGAPPNFVALKQVVSTKSYISMIIPLESDYWGGGG